MSHVSIPPENPFSTRKTRPGTIPFIFLPGDDAESLVARLEQSGWLGEIVGPHGSGKSTLLASLLPAIDQMGLRPVLVELHDGQRRLPLDPRRDECLCPPAVLLIDGYEQLGRLRRFAIRRACRYRGIGLLVTAHAPMGLPSLCRTVVTPELAGQVIGRLLEGCPALLTPPELADSLARHNGNLRETLFDLYDLYERLR
jgi:hypothetical protein